MIREVYLLLERMNDGEKTRRFHYGQKLTRSNDIAN